MSNTELESLIGEKPNIDPDCIDLNNEETVINPNNGMGGLGGSIVKPTGLANVRQFKKLA